MKTNDTNKCLVCGELLDGATATDDGPDTPRPGDLSVCFYCSNIAVFESDLSLRPATAEEVELALRDPHLRRVLHLIRTQMLPLKA